MAPTRSPAPNPPAPPTGTPTSTPPPSDYKSVSLGSGTDSFTVTLPNFPPSSTDAVYKKVALRATITAIKPYILKTTPRSIFEALSTVVPFDLTAIDHKCNTICQDIQSIFLRPDHPSITHTATGFLNPEGRSVTACVDIPSRKANAKKASQCICYVKVTASSKDLSPIHSTLGSIGPISASYILELPTSTDPNPSPTAAAIDPNNLNSDSANTPPAKANADPTPAISANMRSCLSATSSLNHPNYYGQFDFLDSCTAFDATFGPDQPPVVMFDAPNRCFTDNTTDPLPDLTRKCYFACFTSLLKQDYVGADIDNDSATQAVFCKLSNLTATRYDQAAKKKTFHTPTEMLQSFLSLVPTLDSSLPASIAECVTLDLDHTQQN